MASRLQRQAANDIPTGFPTGRHAGLPGGHRCEDDTSSRETVKERVIQTAIAEPFLTVDEIARRVGTSAPYVRTALSLAGLSLGDLRRRTAKELAERLAARANAERAAIAEAAPSGTASATATDSTDQLAAESQAQSATGIVPPTAAIATASHVTSHVELRPDPSAAAILGVPARQPLVVLTYSWPTGGGRGHLGEILTTAPLQLAELSGLVPATASPEVRSWWPLAPAVVRRVQGASRARLDATSACVVYLHEVGLAGEIGPDEVGRGPGWLQVTCVAVEDDKPIAVERVTFDGARHACRLASFGSNSTERTVPELVLR